MEEAAKKFLMHVFDKIEHGDEGHRKWLREELLNFVPTLTSLMELEIRMAGGTII